MQSNIILNHDLNGFQSIRYVNGHVDILYSYDVSFAVQYICDSKKVIIYPHSPTFSWVWVEWNYCDKTEE